jgi:hypothetical protein
MAEGPRLQVNATAASITANTTANHDQGSHDGDPAADNTNRLLEMLEQKQWSIISSLLNLVIIVVFGQAYGAIAGLLTVRAARGRLSAT